MHLSEPLGDTAMSSLPQPVRNAVWRLSAPDSTEDDFYSAIWKLRTAGAPTQAHAVLDMATSKFGLADSLRYQIELALTLATENRHDEALALVAKLKNQYPHNAHAFRIHCELLVRLGKNGEAGHAFRTYAEMLAGIGKYAEALKVIRATPLIAAERLTKEDTVFRGIRLATYMAAADSRPKFVKPKLEAPLEQAVVAMMIRDESDIIAQNLSHHYRMGLRKFVILLNCCRDATESLVKQFCVAYPDAIVCTMVDPVEGYYQAGKSQAAVDFAHSYFAAVRRPATWCFVLDADEFIAIDHERNLADLINAAETQDKDFIAFNTCDGTSAAETEFHPEQDLYEHFDIICGCAVPVLTKTAFRLDLKAQIAMGNHSLSYPQLAVDRCFIAAEFGARLVHFPYRSTAQIKTKIVNGGTAYQASDLAEGLGAHWRVLYKQFVEEGPVVFERQMAVHHRRTVKGATQQAPFFF